MNEVSADEMVLDVKNLQTVFFTNSGLFKAVDDVSFSVRRGETLAIVGESGCGKSVTALSIMRLVPDPPGRIVGGIGRRSKAPTCSASTRPRCARSAATASR